MISYIAAFLAAVANASSNILNRKATQEEPARVEVRPKLILNLLRRRVRLIAVAIMVMSSLLGATALGTGQLAAVQIIIILELPMTLVGGAMFRGSRLGAREWAAIAGMTAGVIGLLASWTRNLSRPRRSLPQSGSLARPPPAAPCWRCSSWPEGSRTRQNGQRCSALLPASGMAWPPPTPKA